MKSKRVLIVDDNDINRKLFENLIGQICFFKSAKNGIEALQMLQEDRYDLIVMDIQMPQMDGITAMKQIRSSAHSDCPIIAVTAFAELEDKNNFIEEGFDDFFIKPIRPKEFLECIKRLLKGTARIQKESSIENEKSIENVILDHQVMKQLMKYNQAKTIKSIYLEFLKECETLVEESIKSFKDGDIKSIGEKFHIIKGNSGTLGANKIFLLSKEGEMNAINENSKETLIALQNLQNEILIFKEYIKEETIFKS